MPEIILRAVFVTARSRLRVPYGFIVTLLFCTETVAGSLVKSFFTVPYLPLTIITFSSFTIVTLGGASTSPIISCSIDVPNQNSSKTLGLCILMRHDPFASRYYKYAHTICWQKLSLPAKVSVLFD